jgi:hypothetical protein
MIDDAIRSSHIDVIATLHGSINVRLPKSHSQAEYSSWVKHCPHPLFLINYGTPNERQSLALVKL